jgi:DNA-binding HxlR family transcriptional regulator
MPIEAFAEQNCAIARTVAFLGERWTPLVLRELFLGRRRFDEIQEELGIASNVLSTRLGTLVDEGVVERRRYSERPERFEYRLTEKGLELHPVLMDLMAWGNRHKVPHGRPIVIVHEDCGHQMDPVQTCSHCGGAVNARNVRAQLGPGATTEQRNRAEARRAA